MKQADAATNPPPHRPERVVPLGGGVALPDTVSETILRRVDGLPPETRRVLGVAALLGREFDLEILAETTGLDVAAVHAAAADAERADVVRQLRPGHYLFSHALVQATLAASIDDRRACRFHRRAADALERCCPADPPYAAMAQHLLAALPNGDRGRAVRTAWKAGDVAAAQLGDDEAAGHYQRAIDAATDPSVTDAVLDPADEAELRLALGEALLRTGKPDRARPVCTEVARIAREIRDPVLLARAALAFGGGADVSIGFEFAGRDDELLALLEEARNGLVAPEHRALRAMVAARLAGANYDAGELDLADRLTSEAVAVARQSQDVRALAYALAARHSAVWRADSLVERLAISDELASLDIQAGTPIGLQGYVWRVADVLERGDFDTAHAQIDSFEAGLVAGAHPRFHWYVWLYRAMQELLHGRLDAAADDIEQARAFGIRAGAYNVGTSYAAQSFFLARERDQLTGVADLLDAFAESQPQQAAWRVASLFARVEEGATVPDARERIAAFVADNCVALQDTGFRLTNCLLVAEVCAQLGDVEGARALYRVLLPYRDRTVVVSRVLVTLGSVEYPLGLCATTVGDLEAAQQHLDAARAAHERLRSPLLTTRVDLACVGLRRALGDELGASQLAASIANVAEERGWANLARRGREAR